MNKIIALSFLLFTVFQCQAQNTWLAGYRFRKAVTFNKSMVSGAGNTLLNFIALVQLEDADLIYSAGAFDQKIFNPNGYDIAFTTVANPVLPLKFQFESYEPSTGKVLCWLQVPEMYTKNESTFKTTVYLYYGSEKLLDPLNAQVWNAVYDQVDHLNKGATGKVGQAASFNGISDYLLKPATPKVSLAISAWIKPEEIGREQVIFSNDTAAVGYLLKIDSFGKLVFEVLDPVNGRTAYVGSTILSTGQWYALSLRVMPNGSSHLITLYLNSVVEFSRGSGKAVLSSNGSMVLARSKQGDRHFKGVIDEWRLGSPITTFEMETDYKNQNSPTTFVSAGAAEQNSDIFSYTFTGLSNSSWNTAVNWTPRGMPTANKSIRVQQGKTLIVPANMVINQLLIEKDASVMIASTATVVNRTILESGSSLSGDNNARLQLQGDLYNSGQVTLDKGNAKLQLYGSRSVLTVQGAGSAKVAALEIDLPAVNARVELQAALQLTVSLQILNGLLKAGGNLHLLSVGGKTATVYPLGRESSISGDVHVQYQVDGPFPTPSSGRGWRLLSSPVFQPTALNEFQYGFKALQKNIFVTGSGGNANGFDVSPNNGATIYTHNQALAGNLPQKYIPISNMNAQVAVGRGFFLFSRGDRNLPDAYQQQIVTRPFVNAAPYLVTYSGNLFKGDLTVQVLNKDEGGEGDGFNLLGNPYAAPIRWGSLSRENVGPNVWIFDPLNNKYSVSNDPETIIPAGTGFFVRVNPGFQSGTVRFDEQAKVAP